MRAVLVDRTVLDGVVQITFAVSHAVQDPLDCPHRAIYGDVEQLNPSQMVSLVENSGDEDVRELALVTDALQRL